MVKIDATLPRIHLRAEYPQNKLYTNFGHRLIKQSYHHKGRQTECSGENHLHIASVKYGAPWGRLQL
jgi:hypothetical protein